MYITFLYLLLLFVETRSACIMYGVCTCRLIIHQNVLFLSDKGKHVAALKSVNSQRSDGVLSHSEIKVLSQLLLAHYENPCERTSAGRLI